MGSSSPFVLDEKSCLKAIRTIAQAPQVTIFVGAGVGIESNLPDWGVLVRRLLTEVGVEGEGLSPEDTQKFVDWTITSESLIGAGAVAQTALGRTFHKKLTEALYRETDDPKPGETARAIAKLRSCWDAENIEVVTTNYDDILSTAIQEELQGSPISGVNGKVLRLTSDSPVPSNRVAVRHLHGAVTSKGKTEGTVVLSEATYFRMNDNSSWQERFVEERLKNSTCIFVGTSLTDPNLLRYLYRFNPSGDACPEHFAIFVRQQEANSYNDVSDLIREAKERTNQRKWDEAGITAIRLNYFAESAQLLYEIAQRRNGEKRNFGQRMRALDTKRSHIFSTAPDKFNESQDAVQVALARQLQFVIETLREDGTKLKRNERLQCSLWIFNSDDNTLTNLYSSDRVWREQKTLDPVKISWTAPTSFASMQAFCGGSMVSVNTEGQEATRWNHVLGVPLFSSGPKFGRLPVGALTLASNLTESKSALNRGSLTIRAFLLELQENCAELLGAEEKPV